MLFIIWRSVLWGLSRQIEGLFGCEEALMWSSDSAVTRGLAKGCRFIPVSDISLHLFLDRNIILHFFFIRLKPWIQSKFRIIYGFSLQLETESVKRIQFSKNFIWKLLNKTICLERKRNSGKKAISQTYLRLFSVNIIADSFGHIYKEQ